jgi:hypothetical protein
METEFSVGSDFDFDRILELRGSLEMALVDD